MHTRVEGQILNPNKQLFTTVRSDLCSLPPAGVAGQDGDKPCFRE